MAVHYSGGGGLLDTIIRAASLGAMAAHRQNFDPETLMGQLGNEYVDAAGTLETDGDPSGAWSQHRRMTSPNFNSDPVTGRFQKHKRA